MNTLENKLKISENTAIHCPTLELAKQVLSIFDQLRLKWCTERNYMIYHNWDIYKENTVYYPFDGEVSPLKFAQEEGYKIISAEEFITLHTEDKEFNLENYEPKEQLEGFPKEIIKQMLECQEEQGNKRDILVFEKDRTATMHNGGFDWNLSKESYYFWDEVIFKKNFDRFFKKYPKKEEIKVCSKCHKEVKSTQSSVEIEINTNQDNSQKFKVGDKVYDILLKEVGVVQDIVHSSSIPYGLSVEFKSGVKSYTINGCYIPEYKNPHVLHYRDDYNYDVIDFNNLPKRQEPKRWRVKKGGIYYFINRNEYDFNLDKIYKSIDGHNHFANNQYKIGNYFQTEEEAQEVADKLKKYFQELIKI